VSDPDNIEAEFAIITRTDLHGLGTMLMKKATGDVSNDNAPMHAFMHDRGFGIRPDCREPGVTHCRLDPAAGQRS